MTTDILHACGYAAIFLVIGLAVLALSYFVLDLITPGHKLGNRMAGATTEVHGVAGMEQRQSVAPSYGAAVVTGAWMIMQGTIIWRALWTNAVGSHLGDAIVWSIVFSILGILLQAIGFLILDLLTPGKLGDEVCAPGPVRPLAWLAAANIVAVGLIVIAVIS